MYDSPTKEQRSPSKSPSRAQSAMQRSQHSGYDDSRPESAWRARSRLGEEQIYFYRIIANKKSQLKLDKKMKP